ncbi:MAG: BLUF domain-containing protein [Chthoniobacterales bacterium]
MVIFQLVYVSRAADSFSADDLLELLRQSRENNERAGVSGMLLFKERRFLQLLEGDEASVRATFQRIQRDPRHHEITSCSKTRPTCATSTIGRWPSRTSTKKPPATRTATPSS